MLKSCKPFNSCPVIENDKSPESQRHPPNMALIPPGRRDMHLSTLCELPRVKEDQKLRSARRGNNKCALTFLNFFSRGTLPEHLREFPFQRRQWLARRQPGSGRHNCAPSCDHPSPFQPSSDALIQTLPYLTTHCPPLLSNFQQTPPLVRIYAITKP